MKRWLIRCLLRCYPRPWRRRYGEEFAALLEQTPIDLRQMLDALRSALDARWRGRWPVGVLESVRLGSDERQFYRQWVLALFISGMAVGGIYYFLLPYGINLGSRRGTNVATFMFWWSGLVLGPLLALVALGLGVVQWWTLQKLLPAISRWWIMATLVGPLAALAMMTTERTYSTLPDLGSMTQFFISYLSQVSAPYPYQTSAYDLVLIYILPTLCFCGIASSFQAYLLKGVVALAGWWIGVALLAALAGVAAAQVGDRIRSEAFLLVPAIVRPDLALGRTGIGMVQFGAACAVYGIVSGLGLIALCRGQQEMPAAVATAR